MNDTTNQNPDGDQPYSGTAGVGDDYTYYVPAHSDFLIHWTGNDIDHDNDPDWYSNHSSATDSDVTRLYFTRLKSILKYGLWMTEDDESITMRGNAYSRPAHCRTCFTELKLSMVRGHARRYGRLGLGFKRPFLLNRFGRPMVYYHDQWNDWFEPRMWSPRQPSYCDFFSCFLKPMSEKTPDTTMRYTFYDESEWRIIYSDEIAARLKDRGHTEVLDHFVPERAFNHEFQREIDAYPKRPQALIPIKDTWFAMIIYPSLAAKIASESDPEIRQLVKNIKPDGPMPPNYPKCNPAPWEPYGKPFEIDLDSCRNF